MTFGEDPAVVKKLLDQGADINQRDDNGRSALMFAAINAHYETMNMLLEHGADVNARSNVGGTALMAAALAGDLRMVKALLDQGADTHASLRDKNESASTIAASRGYDEIAHLLGEVK